MPRPTTTIDPALIAIGEALREAREKAKIDQSELARRLKRKQAAVSQWESGKRCPALRDLPLIAAALRVHPWKLAQRIFEKIRTT
jgi:transcriptional regulator with XRE-family HTH domain